MHIKTILDNVASFLIEPHKQDSSSHIKKLAWATTIILGIGTLGAAQGLSLLWKKLRANPHHTVDEKVNKAVKPLLNPLPLNKKETPINSKMDLKLETIKEVSKTPSFQDISQGIYNQRDKLWGAAKTKAAEQGALGDENVMLFFIESIRTEFRKEKRSLSEISKNPESLAILFKSYRVRLAVLHYAYKNKLDLLISQHLNYVVSDFTNQKANYINESVKLAKEMKINEPEKILEILVTLVEINFKKEGYNLKEIHKHPELLAIVKNNSFLNSIVDYLNKKEEHLAKPSISPEIDHDKDERQKAIKLAKQHAQEGKGLLTKLHLKDVPEEELAKVVRQKFLKNHPDKNKDADPVLVQNLRALLELIKLDNFKVYQQILKQERR